MKLFIYKLHCSAVLDATSLTDLEELRAMIANHWSANVGRASTDQIKRWQDWIDDISTLINAIKGS